MKKLLHLVGALSATAALSLAVPAGALAQSAFPERPLRFIVPFAAGGATDIVARVVAQKMGEAVGQTVIVENRPGGGTLIGTRAVLQAPADGYTILMSSSTMATGPLLYKSPGYSMSDFKLLAPIGSVGFALSMHASVPASNLRELVAYAKANPGKLNSGSLGGGGATRLLSERFAAAAGIKMTEVTYGGGAPALRDLLGGNIQVFLDGITTTAPQAKSPNIRILAVTTDRRSALLPDVPTFREQGYPTMTSSVWFALYVSEKTPPAVIAKLHAAATQAVSAAEVKDKLVAIGAEPWPASQDFQSYVQQDTARFAEDIRRLGLQPQD